MVQEVFKNRRKLNNAEKSENTPLTLSEINALAKENGMTYGEFVAKFPNK